MTHQEVIEGTWKELAAYAEVLKGGRLRLIMLPVKEIRGLINESAALSETDDVFEAP